MECRSTLFKINFVIFISICAQNTKAIAGKEDEEVLSAISATEKLKETCDGSLSPPTCRSAAHSRAITPIASASSQSEPSYCNTLKQNEIPLEEFPEGLQSAQSQNHLHGFNVGPVKLVGVSVGASDPENLKKMAKKLSKTTPSGDDSTKYCTWYLNSPEGDEAGDQSQRWAETASREFNYYPIKPNPKKAAAGKIEKAPVIQEFMRVLNEGFLKQREPNLLTCLSKYHYLALGCNGMNHRGPLMFGMLLAYSGCSIESTSTIINSLWPVKSQESEIRKEILREAFFKGSETNSIRDEIQRVLSSSSR